VSRAGSRCDDVPMDKLTRILIVTPDSARCAALIDKAALLARCFDARIELLETGSADEVLAYVEDHPVDLVIKQPASEHPLRRWTFESGDRRLAERSRVPVLLARARPWARPPRFAAAVDVADRDSEAMTRGILQASGFLSLGTAGLIDVLYAERELRDDYVRMERAVRVAALVREFRVGGESLQLIDGAPDKKLPPLLARRHYDVLVLGGATRRTGVAGVLHSLSATLAEAAGCDVLLVNETLPRAASLELARSARNQPLHEREQLA
jgi:nucleotide-binding universal stress UspA family protein